MSAPKRIVHEWDFLIGFPLEEAQQILKDEAVSYELLFTAAPGRVSSPEDAFVIVVRTGDALADDLDLVLICASANWAVN